MLLGEYEHTIDEKNRLTLPARFRESFSEGVVISRGMDRCLSMYPRAEWERTVDARLGALDPLSREARSLQRYFYSAATEAELDRQGRVVIPAALVQYAALGRDVVVAGVRERLEIWNRNAWHKQRDEIEGSAEHVAQRLATERT
jgi:transcriptional regulator MraZ